MRIRAAAYALIVRDDEVLLAHWRDGQRHAWTLPGGGLEAGEHPEAACIREVEEETGYLVELTGLLGVDSAVIPANDRLRGEREPLHALRILYGASIIGGELSNELDGSTDEAAWHRIEDVPSLRRVGLVDFALERIPQLPDAD